MRTRYKVLIAGVVAIYAVLILFWVVPLQPDTLERQLSLQNLAYPALGLTLLIGVMVPSLPMLLMIQTGFYIYLIVSWAKRRNVVIPLLGLGFLSINVLGGLFVSQFTKLQTDYQLGEVTCNHEGENVILLKHLTDFAGKVVRYVFFSANSGEDWTYIYHAMRPTFGNPDTFSADCSDVHFDGTQVTYYEARENGLWSISTNDNGQTWNKGIVQSE